MKWPSHIVGGKKILPPRSPSITLGGCASLYWGEDFFQVAGNSLHMCKEACHIFGSTKLNVVNHFKRSAYFVCNIGTIVCSVKIPLATLAPTPNSRNDRPLIKIFSPDQSLQLTPSHPVVCPPRSWSERSEATSSTCESTRWTCYQGPRAAWEQKNINNFLIMDFQ